MHYTCPYNVAGSILRIVGLQKTLSSSPVPSSPLHSLPLEVGPLNPARGSGERCKLRVWGRAPAEFWILVHLALKSDIWWQQF